MSKTFEVQYDKYVNEAETSGFETLGLMSSQSWRKDPKHLLFYLSRYKFVAKMFSGLNSVLEVGCGDGFASRIVRQSVVNLTLTDIDPVFLADIKRRTCSSWPVETLLNDYFIGPIQNKEYDGIYSLDVLEHIPAEKDELFLQNIVKNLTATGVMIIGVPNLESLAYASEDSKVGHINLMSQKKLKHKLEKFFNNVFIFSMNDEVVHTGFYAMSHYNFALCANQKRY